VRELDGVAIQIGEATSDSVLAKHPTVLSIYFQRLRMSRKIKLAIAALVFAALSSIAVNIVFFRMGSRFFRELNDVRLDPYGLTTYAGQSPPDLGADHRRVVFFGDSRAYMWQSPSDTTHYQFVNRGISYQTTAQILGRFDQDIPPLHPDVMVIEMGVNDLKTIPLFPARRKEITDTAIKNIGTIVKRCNDLGATVIIVTIFPIGPVELSRRPFWSDDVAGAVVDANKAIDALASDKVLVLHADQTLLGTDGKIRGDYALDTLHLTPAAYQALNDQQLSPMLQRASSSN
jgi:lysophospholipase L1-like esterase